MRSRAELERLVKGVKKCRNSRMSTTAIARSLKISTDDAYLFSTGYLSREAYEKDYLKLREQYHDLIEGKLKKLLFLGWPINTIKVDKSIKLSFLKKPEKEAVLRDLKDHIRKNIEQKLKEDGKKDLLEGLTDEIFVKYYNGIYNLRPATLRARAFLESYGNLVLRREIGQVDYT